MRDNEPYPLDGMQHILLVPIRNSRVNFLVGGATEQEVLEALERRKVSLLGVSWISVPKERAFRLWKGGVPAISASAMVIAAEIRARDSALTMARAKVRATSALASSVASL
jgi:hypothetical protein